MKRMIIIASCAIGLSLLGSAAFAQDVPKDTLKGGRNDPMYRNAPSRTNQNKTKTDTTKSKAPGGTIYNKKKSSSGEDAPMRKDTTQWHRRTYPNGPAGGTGPKK